MTPTFACGHGRTPANTIAMKQKHKDGTPYTRCALCARARSIVIQAERAQRRINAGGYTLGERISSGVGV